MNLGEPYDIISTGLEHYPAADVARQSTENVAATIVGTDGRRLLVIVHTR